MSRSLINKVIVITGGAQGIGFEIADKFLESNAKVAILLDIDENLGVEAANKLNMKHGRNKAIFMKCDVTMDLEEISKNIFSTYEVDVLVNNAGLCDISNPKLTIAVNVTAVVEWSYKFWEHMTIEKNGKGGTIINIASIYGFRVDQYVPLYQASKFAVMGFTRSLGHFANFERSGVRVVAICPGFTKTSLTEKASKSKEVSEFLKTVLWQTVDVVGNAALEVYQKADSGTAWLIEGANPIVEV